MKAIRIALALALCAGTLGGCYVYDPYYYPYGYGAPATYDRSWAAQLRSSPTPRGGDGVESGSRPPLAPRFLSGSLRQASTNTSFAPAAASLASRS